MNLQIGGSSGLLSSVNGSTATDSGSGIKSRLSQASTNFVQRKLSSNAAEVELSASAISNAQSSTSSSKTSIETSSARSFLDVAGGAAEAVKGILGEIDGLTKKLGSESDPTKKQNLEKEIGSLVKSLDETVASAEVKGQNVFGKKATFEVGSQKISFAFADISSSGLGIEKPKFTLEGREEEVRGGSDVDGEFQAAEDMQVVDGEQQVGGKGSVVISEGTETQTNEEEVDPEPVTISVADFQSKVQNAANTVSTVQSSIEGSESLLNSAAKSAGYETEAASQAEKSVKKLGEQPEALASKIAAAVDNSLVESSSTNLSAVTVESLLTREQPEESKGRKAEEEDRQAKVEREKKKDSEESNSLSLLEQIKAEQETKDEEASPLTQTI
ncbi:MAG: hypothetical protein KDD66_07440 [Bdellovibrionales bacterium]|nr:hypothetical protein [Bdellovibrionales bacterium]